MTDAFGSEQNSVKNMAVIYGAFTRMQGKVNLTSILAEK
jgi:hypothetical protein